LKYFSYNCKIKELIGFEGIYWIDEDGHIFNRHGRCLKPTKDSSGYLQVNLKSKSTSIHRLVAQQFIPNPLGLETVNHIDGNKLNNHISNLEWMTREDNIKHGHQNNLIKYNFGEDNGQTKLTKELVLEIREKYASGNYSYTKLGFEYGVERTTIYKIIKRKNWKHI